MLLKNKLGAILINTYAEYEEMSRKYNVKTSEIVEIDFNRCGVYLPNKEVKEGFRVRFKGKILDDYESWFALPVRAENETNFRVVDNQIFFKEKLIGDVVGGVVLDTCESSYMRGPKLLNLNSRSRSNCGGCKACIHNYHDFYDESVIKDKKSLITKADIIEFFKLKRIDVAKLKQIAVVTGLFGTEENVVEHMKLIYEVAKSLGFDGELMYFGCEVNSDKALQELSELGNFSIVYALDNFTKRDKILSYKKAKLTIDDCCDCLRRAKLLNIKTSIAYIAGIDSLQELQIGFSKVKEFITDFPIVNIYQIQNQGQAELLDNYAESLEYYIEARIILEKEFSEIKIFPKRWTNYRPLWYKTYNNIELPNNAYGQIE